MTGGLGEELREHITRSYCAVPVAERRRSQWVMDPEWLNDVRMLALSDRGGVWRVQPQPAELLIMGLPFELRKGAGPPHLEPLSP